MTSVSNSSSPNSSTAGGETIEVYVDGRTKGSHGSKRSVTRLTKEQLEKKRFNDRESQRNIRRRNKERIATLEAKVKELEEQHDPADVERLKKRNKDLEAENERLKGLEAELETLRKQVQMLRTTAPDPQIPPTIDEVDLPTTTDGLPADWDLDAATQAWAATNVLDTSMDADELTIPATLFRKPDMTAPEFPLDDPINPTMDYGATSGQQPDLQQRLASNIDASWNDLLATGSNSQNFSKAGGAWGSMPFALTQPSRFAGLYDQQQQSMSDYYENSTCWQTQPSVYAWQISTKIKPPVTFVDQLLIRAIQCQRHIARTAGITGEEVIGPYVPNVELLFTGADAAPEPVAKELPKELPLSLTLQETMNLYSTIVSRRGFAFLAEKLASFIAMYRFVRWQIEPTYETFQGLYPWQAPIQAQREIPHPAWMDLPPWEKFRDKLIRNQDKYGTPEFQIDYASNLNVNWPGNALSTVIMENGQIKISQAMDRHLSDVNNLTMRKPFGDKYPEFHEVVRIDEV